MSNREQLFNVIFIFVATAALGAILGLSVLRTVDTRLSDVAINIPEIKVPQAQVKVEWPERIIDELKRELSFQNSLQANYRPGETNYAEVMEGGAIDNLPTTVRQERRNDPLPDGQGLLSPLSENIEKDNYRFRKRQPPVVGEGEIEPVSTLPPSNQLLADQPLAPPYRDPRRIFNGPDFRRMKDQINNSNYYLAAQQMESHKVSNYPPIHPHRSHQDIDHYEANRQHLGRPKKRTPECVPHQFINGEYYDQPCGQKQYYKHPNEMTERQIVKFKKYAKFDKMTARDYMNWLSLYVNEPDILTPHNQKMLKRFKRRKVITEKDIPKDERITKSSKELFNELYDDNY